jgi:ribosomal protein L9
MSTLDVQRLLQNPMGEPAPPGARGDIVRVSDGTAAIYLTPTEYEKASERELRYLLARKSMGRDREGA